MSCPPDGQKVQLRARARLIRPPHGNDAHSEPNDGASGGVPALLEGGKRIATSHRECRGQRVASQPQRLSVVTRVGKKQDQAVASVVPQLHGESTFQSLEVS
jgi:hypothetical protein